ncbi:MAG TPA: anhydro-N-acetylmuramic acid kinase [Gemmatimonadales bacterium]
MSERPVLAVGLMSGTSLDGMDAALVRLHGPTRADLLAFHTRPYTSAERAELTAGMREGGARALAHLHARLGVWAAEAVQAALDAGRVRAMDLDFIAMHGQTVWHEPPVVTWQLGEPAILAERFGVRVVSGFRGRDVAAGGQGAPLVPIADVLLFGGERPRVLLNIGGMANLTYVPRRDEDEGAFAFDTGPGMAIIDAVARLVEPGLSWDVDGRLAASGTVDDALLAELLRDPWFLAPPPKSTGREHFGDDYAARLHARVGGPDGVATAVALTADSIGNALGHWVPPVAEVVLSGGGAHHPGLVERLERRLPAGAQLRRFDDLFFSGDAKEAVAFALLGYLTIHGQPGNLPGVTGAAGRRVLGTITPA